VAEQPEQVLPQQRVAAARGSKKAQPAARSSSSRMLPRISGGKPTMIISAVTSMYQANIGIWCSDMPAARVRRIDTAMSMAAAMAAISMKVMPSSQKSALRPGE
jgi:hypothetical protein